MGSGTGDPHLHQDVWQPYPEVMSACWHVIDTVPNSSPPFIPTELSGLTWLPAGDSREFAQQSCAHLPAGGKRSTKFEDPPLFTWGLASVIPTSTSAQQEI